MGIKKGATLCSNLVNLKSNTMKNTDANIGGSDHNSKLHHIKHMFYNID